MRDTCNPLNEALAIARLRQWIRDRTAARSGRIANYKNEGWRERRACELDARIVRMIDFSRAIETLPDAEKTALILCYGQGETRADAARIVRCSERTMSNLIPRARHHLAETLDRLDLL